jgi:hypothetical protein
MGSELVIFTILTVLMLGSGLVGIFHVKQKPLSDRRRTAHGLINLILGAWATVTILIMVGFI